jgi:P-type Ca2+ transporter type 2C
MASIYNKSVHAILSELETSEHGLSATDAEERLRRDGPNSIRVKGDPFWKKLVEPFANVFMFVLLLAAGISFYHHDTVDAIIILIIMGISAGIYYIQRFSTERILRSLQRHTAQAVSVWRDGKLVDIDSENLVVGDVIVLREGEKIPADGRLIIASSVRSDESLLTGESQPVSKQLEQLHGEKEVYEQTNILFQGAFIVAGEATAVVIRTGNDTEFGQLAALTQNQNTESPVQQKIDKLITQIIAVVGAMALVTFGLSLLRGMELTESIKFVMALSVSAVPESLPVAISVILVLGMRRMASRKALVSNMRAIETVGAITTIATDKTGTLTKNKLTVQEVWQPTFTHHHISEIAERTVNGDKETAHDPLDTAMIDYVDSEHLKPITAKVVATLPFDQARAMSGNVWHHGANYTLDVKGAPEHVLQHSQLTETEHEQAMVVLHRLTAQGYRVIAIATTVVGKPIESFADLPKKAHFEFVGFIAVADVLRPEAKKAISAALSAGVTVRMITGDHLETAYHIARQLGMVSSRDQIFDARHMNVMSDDELDRAIHDVRVFARVIPEHKYRILALLKRHNITAMTGDGVNDVPALTNAHVGVAMGSGSQIAKDAGDIILLDDNFKSIIDAMREGRVIVSNIRRMLYYLLATNAGEALTMMGALVVGMPVPLLPVQILWVNLVTDSALVIPLGLEKGEKNVMRHPPKRPNSPILSRYIITRMAMVALSMAATTLTIYAIYTATDGPEYARTIAFCALVVMQWSNAINARSDYESLFSRLRVWSTPFAIGLTIAFTAQMLAIFGPLHDWLHLETVLISDLVITGVIAFLVPIVLVEVHKFIGRRIFNKGHEPDHVPRPVRISADAK